MCTPVLLDIKKIGACFRSNKQVTKFGNLALLCCVFKTKGGIQSHYCVEMKNADRSKKDLYVVLPNCNPNAERFRFVGMQITQLFTKKEVYEFLHNNLVTKKPKHTEE